MINNFLVTAFRFLSRHKLFSAINLAGLGVSIAVFILISQYALFLSGTDGFHKQADRIYRIERKGIHNMAAPIGPYLLSHYPEIEQSVRMEYKPVSNGLISYDRRSIKLEDIWLADSTFFQVFSFPLKDHSPDHVFSAPDRIVLSESAAERLFGLEDPVGKQVMLDNRFSLQVDAVMKDFPSNSSIQADAVIAFDFNKALHDDPLWLESFTRWNYNNILLLAPDADPGELTARINKDLFGFLTSHIEIPADQQPDFILTPLRDIYFNHYDSYDFFRHGSRSNVYVALGIALIILFLAIVNFINLTTAQATERATDIGLRKTMGAGKRHILLQHLSESVLATYLATLLAIVLVYLLLPLFNSLVRFELPFNPLDPLTLGLLITGPLVLGILAGIYPSLYLSSFPPVRILSATKAGEGRGNGFRKVLIVIQFAAAIALIIFTIHVERQVDYLNHKELGFTRQDKYVLEVSPEVREHRASLMAELLGNPLIKSASFHYMPIGQINEQWGVSIGQKDMSFRIILADSSYIRTMGISLLQGRNYRNHEPGDSGYQVLLNEESVRAYGFPEPVGLSFRFFGRPYQVTGVVNDFHYESLHKPIEPLMIINRDISNYLTIRYAKGKDREALALIGTLWQKYSPNYPLSCQSLSANLEKLYTEEARLKRISLGFSILAILIASIGMFGLTLFQIGKKTREVGIRKAMGSSGLAIVRLFIWEFGRLVLISILIAFPVAWWAINRWMHHFITPSGQSWLLYVLAGALSLMVASLTVLIQSVRAARTNPAESLRYD